MKPTTTAALAALLVMGAALAAPAAARPRSRTPFQEGDVEVLVNGRPAPHYFRAGEHHVLARKGDRYTLRVWNRSPVRVEAVVSVDGRDVLDGQSADYRTKRGYVIPGNGYVDVDGWRLSGQEVAVFRFGDAKDAYAARAGARADIGVVGVAFFPEGMTLQLPWWQSRVPRPPLPPPWVDQSRGSVLVGPPAVATSLDAGVAPKANPAPPKPSVSPPAAAPAAKPPAAKPAVAAPTTISSAAEPSPGLGTEFGERVASPVRELSFVRLDPLEPAQIFVLHYNDRPGLQALGIDVKEVAVPGAVAGELERRRAANPFPNSTRTYASPPAGWKR